MTKRIIKAVLAGPRLSAGISATPPNDAIAKWLAKATDDGITLFLTAISADEIASLVAWYTSQQSDLRTNVRVITPARFYWPGGMVRLPFQTRVPEEAARSVVNDLDAVIKTVLPSASVTCDATDGHLSVVGPRTLPEGLPLQLWTTGNQIDETIGIDPESALEAYHLHDDVWETVIGPVKPSTSWDDVLSFVERFKPANVYVVPEDGESVEAFKRHFWKDEPQGVADRPKASDEDLIFAPRLAAPSLIHFIRQWSDTNRRYVRQSYWNATTTARDDLAKAEGRLKNLDKTRYRRAETLVDLAHGNGGHRLLDDYSGAICFAPGFYEFELPSSTGNRAVDELVQILLEYFDKKLDDMPFDRPLLRRRLFSNSLVLLRGEGYYANLKQIPPWERAKDYIKEADALVDTFRKLEEIKGGIDAALEQCIGGGNNFTPAWKLLIGAFDQARNLGLIMLSVGLHLWRESDRKRVDENLIGHSTRLVIAYYKLLLGDVDLKGRSICTEIVNACIKAKSELERLDKQESDRAKNSDWYEPGRPIRGWREADNPYENLLVALLAADSVSTSKSAALGIFWGGTELPIAAKVAGDALGKPIEKYGFISRGRYSSAAEQDDKFYCDLATGQIERLEKLRGFQSSTVLLLDDNALSGQTLESARDLLLKGGLELVETWVVRFSGERREGQMRMADSGIVHPAYLEGRLKGFLGETPYARSYSRKDYASPVGVFNTARSRILRYLHNNGFASVFEREGF